MTRTADTMRQAYRLAGANLDDIATWEPGVPTRADRIATLLETEALWVEATRNLWVAVADQAATDDLAARQQQHPSNRALLDLKPRPEGPDPQADEAPEPVQDLVAAELDRVDAAVSDHHLTATADQLTDLQLAAVEASPGWEDRAHQAHQAREADDGRRSVVHTCTPQLGAAGGYATCPACQSRRRRAGEDRLAAAQLLVAQSGVAELDLGVRP